MNIKAVKTIEKYHMLQNANKVIVALSGGADSVALFHFLMENRARYQIEIAAAHLNHGLRAAADADEKAVRKLCEQTGVPLFVKRVDMMEGPRPRGKGTEEWGRELRYAFFSELAEQHGALVATAHTLSDNAETLLFNIARGTGLKGMGGIPPVRGFFIRPLIETTRAQVELYCATHGLSYVQDQTNFEDTYARNRIRHHVVPTLQGVNSAFLENAGALAGEMAQLYTYVQAHANTLLEGAAVPGGYACRHLLAADEVLRRHALYSILQPAGNVSRRAVALCESLLEKGGSVQVNSAYTFHVHGGVCVLKESTARAPAVANTLEYQPFSREAAHVNAVEQAIVLAKKAAEAANTTGENMQEGSMRVRGVAQKGQALQAWYELPAYPGVYHLPGGHVLRLTCVPYEEFVNNRKNSLKNAVDYDIINGIAFIRTRRSGDRFSPVNRGVSKSLKKYFSEEKIPVAVRDTLPLLCMGAQVLYLPGKGAAQNAAPTSKTKTILYITHEGPALEE
ncbi:tRNA lysidine(34) synthetase TilS [Ruminococcaceae bacterium OttesenSCG-928-N02]|nr:tRNA lysidine(34) synthetase TilS [Ruminococcaceae bacterium OttesenSCG-928-N02]